MRHMVSFLRQCGCVALHKTKVSRAVMRRKNGDAHINLAQACLIGLKGLAATIRLIKTGCSMMTSIRMRWLPLGLIVLSFAGCTSVEPLDTSLTTQSTPQIRQADTSIIAERVGESAVGVEPLAWANPSTGSTGVIEEITVAPGLDGECRNFVTTQRSLQGESRIKGVACHSANAGWKVSPAN
ncbi:RT0821/Lpp0805 family surface protein [Rhizobium sp. BK176]|uniref:RT0821/Lpp0805 family surface protein n=1 Tax=Rhizobium sp. BK176 TaxID=2587071 RepID=UPI0021697C80|nr:RT0821/Lpp0805 family surface protein [Rhizobium sp. BK176]MCS4095107.1 hypothetical protein [Rhizobium sp. BK176]